MKSMDWPPRLVNGRLGMASGASATRILVMMTLGDLQQNPFNPPGLSLGDITFRVDSVVKARVYDSLRRLEKLISVQGVTETKTSDGMKTITVDFIDRETRTQGSAVING